MLNGTRVTGGRGPAAVGTGQRVGEGHVGPVARPQATAFGEDAYPDMLTKAAALPESVVNNHALVDGNKRLGWLATAVFLELNDVPITTASNDDVYKLVMDVAGGRLGVEEIAKRLRGLVGD